MSNLKVVSLCCGAGGADLGAKGGFEFLDKHYAQHPIEIVSAVDIDKFAIKTYRHNFGETGNAIVGDICSLKAEDLPEHDLLIAGFPCQPFSTMTIKKKANDKRINIFRDVLRVVEGKRPKFVMLENVANFVNFKGGRFFKELCDHLSKLGYRVSYRIINCADFGIPQTRRRVFIFGVLEELGMNYEFPKSVIPKSEWIPLGEVLDEKEHLNTRYHFSQTAVETMKRTAKPHKVGTSSNISKPCNTIKCTVGTAQFNYRNPVVLVDRENEIFRRLTPREAARVQGFPDSFEFPVSNHQAYKQIGNAIPPLVAWHLVDALINQLNSLNNSPKTHIFERVEEYQGRSEDIILDSLGSKNQSGRTIEFKRYEDDLLECSSEDLMLRNNSIQQLKNTHALMIEAKLNNVEVVPLDMYATRVRDTYLIAKINGNELLVKACAKKHYLEVDKINRKILLHPYHQETPVVLFSPQTGINKCIAECKYIDIHLGKKNTGYKQITLPSHKFSKGFKNLKQSRVNFSALSFTLAIDESGILAVGGGSYHIHHTLGAKELAAIIYLMLLIDCDHRKMENFIGKYGIKGGMESFLEYKQKPENEYFFNSRTGLYLSSYHLLNQHAIDRILNGPEDKQELGSED